MTVSLTVLVPFYDLHAHRLRAEGETFEVTEGRAAEIATVLPGYVELKGEGPVRSAENKGEAEGPAKDKETANQDLSKNTVAQLRAIAAERGIDIPKGSKKADIIALLEE